LIKAVLKEYNFTPPQLMLEINDGETKNVTIQAKRVAFSAFGTVANLNADGIENLQVQALPTTVEHSQYPTETAVTDGDGKFRIRGLIPGVNYTIGVVPSQYVLSVKPKEVTATIGKQDIQNIDFLMFEKPSTFAVSGSITFDPLFTQSDIDDIEAIDIILYDKENREPLQKKTVKLFKYFEFTNLHKNDYFLKISYKRLKASGTTDHEENIDSSQFGESHRIIKSIVLQKPDMKLKDHTTKGTTFALPVIILVLIFAFFNKDEIQNYFKKYMIKNNRKSVKKN